MKDSEFIQLLNLYLDHEISAADSARLEAEVQANPARRRIYQDYCRMQKACKVLAHEFQTEAAPAPERKVIDFQSASRPARTSSFYAAGAFAALAACVAVVFVSRNRDSMLPTPTGQELAARGSAVPDAAPPAVTATALAQNTARLPAQPALVGTSLTLAGNAQADAMRVASVEQANAQFEWMRKMQFAPLPQAVPMEDLRFDARPAALQTEARTFRSAQPVDAPTEMVVFRFTR